MTVPYAGFGIYPNGQTVVVTITYGGNNATVTCYTTAAGTVSQTNPQTITLPTKFFVPTDGPFVVSAKVGGVEMLGSTYYLEESEFQTLGVPILTSVAGSVAKGAIVYDIRDYGAVADNGTTDNGAIINTVIGFGGITFIPPGNWGCTTTITMGVGAHLSGVNGGGPGVIPASTSRSCLRWYGASGTTFIDHPVGSGPTLIDNIEVDGRSLAGILLNWDDAGAGEEAEAKTQNCYIHDNVAGYDAVYYGALRRNARFINVFVRDAAMNSFTMVGSDCMFVNCTSAAAGYHGMQLKSGSANTRYIGGEIFGSGTNASLVSTTAISGVSVANPAVITYAAQTPALTSGQVVHIAGVTGATAVNVDAEITVLSPTTFSIPVNNSNAWISGGTVQVVGAGLKVDGAASQAQSVFYGTSFDRNQMMGIMLANGCNLLTINSCILHSDSQLTTATWPCIYNVAGNSGITISGNMFCPAVNVSFKPTNAVFTPNASKWADAGNSFSSSGFSTGAYTNNFPSLQGSSFGTTVNFPPGNDARTPLTISQNSGTQSNDLLQFLTSAGSTCGSSFDKMGRMQGKGAATSAATGAAIGSGGSPAFTVTGSSVSGTITMTTGSGSLASGTLGTVTFNDLAWGAAPKVLITPTGNTGGIADQYKVAVNSGTGSFILTAPAALTASTTYTWNYFCVG